MWFKFGNRKPEETPVPEDFQSEQFFDRLQKWFNNTELENQPENPGKEDPAKELPKEQLQPDQTVYSLMIKNARELEKVQKTEEALAIYLDILSKFTPADPLYYERPAIILDRLGRYDESISICIRAIKMIEQNSPDADPAPFHRRIDRLSGKLVK